MKLKLNVIACSTRPGRQGPALAQWLARAAHGTELFDIEPVDLADFGLPVFDEPEHPKLQKYLHEHTKKWAASVASAQAFVFVTPEYNHAPPPSLLNAIDYLVKEWAYKPVAFFSYGGVGGGLRAVQMTKQIVTTLRMVPIMDNLQAFNFSAQIDASGTFTPNDAQVAGVAPMLAELHKLAHQLKPMQWPAAQATPPLSTGPG